MTTPPHRPTRTIGRRGPLLRNPRAPPEQLGGPLWPQELASAGAQDQALFTCNHQADALRLMGKSYEWRYVDVSVRPDSWLKLPSALIDGTAP